MNKYLRYFTLLFAVPCLMVASCKKDDDVDKSKVSKVEQSTIAGVNGPTSGLVNKELTFSLLWQNTEGTSKFDHLQDSISDHTTIIRLFALTNVADTAATAKNLNTVDYKFKADSAGTYYLKFYRADNSEKTVIIDTLTIK
ncbi:MAG: hypothetical protein V4592_22155 [Bacteroidota bacterium]